MPTKKQYYVISTTLDIGSVEIFDLFSNKDFFVSKTNYFAVLSSLYNIQDNYNNQLSLVAEATGDYFDLISNDVFDSLFEEILINEIKNKNRKYNLILDRGTSPQRNLLYKCSKKLINKYKSIIIYTHPIIISMRKWIQITELYKKTNNSRYLEALSIEGEININKYCIRFVELWIDSIQKITSSYKIKKNLLFIQYEDLYEEFDLTFKKISNFLGNENLLLENINALNRDNFKKEYDMVRKIDKSTISYTDKTLRKRLPMKFIKIY